MQKGNDSEGMILFMQPLGGFENEVVQGIITNEGNINILDNTEDYKDYSKKQAEGYNGK